MSVRPQATIGVRRILDALRRAEDVAYRSPRLAEESTTSRARQLGKAEGIGKAIDVIRREAGWDQ